MIFATHDAQGILFSLFWFSKDARNIHYFISCRLVSVEVERALLWIFCSVFMSHQVDRWYRASAYYYHKCQRVYNSSKYILVVVSWPDNDHNINNQLLCIDTQICSISSIVHFAEGHNFFNWSLLKKYTLFYFLLRWCSKCR